MRESLHTHPCQRCRVPVLCQGDLEPNHDGFPVVICRAFHLDGGQVDCDFLCATCAETPDEPGDVDGEDLFRDVAAELRDAAAEAWKLK